MFEEEEVSIEALDDTTKDESIAFYLELRENFNEFYGESEEMDVFMYQHLFDYLGFFEEELEHYFNGVTNVLGDLTDEKTEELLQKYIVNFYRMSDEVKSSFSFYLEENLKTVEKEIPENKFNKLIREALIGIDIEDYRFILRHLLSLDDFECFSPVMLAFVHQLKRRVVFV